MSRSLVFLLYPGFQILDHTGPLAAFDAANHFAPGSYRMQHVSRDGGALASYAGLEVVTESFEAVASPDTLIISGGSGIDQALACPATQAFVRRHGQTCRRLASVCSGAFLLASLGMLDGLRATTHWRRTTEFQRRFPAVQLEVDRIYVREGRLWTSAGITAGIDLALALIAEDLGETIARQVARQLVVYYRRPGGQTQHSELLALGGEQGRFADLMDFIRRNLERPLTVEELADQACMSARHFARVFREEMGETPARAVERLRVEAASNALASGYGSLKAVARQCGFVDTERMRRAFMRWRGVPPAALKQAARCSTTT